MKPWIQQADNLFWRHGDYCKKIINIIDVVKSILSKTKEFTNAALMNVVYHRFHPYDATGVAIHTNTTFQFARLLNMARYC